MHVLIAGGYGVVGEQIARILRKRNPQMALTIAGRTLSKAQQLAGELGDATGAVFDVDEPGDFERLPSRPDIAIVSVNDLTDATFRTALRSGIGLVDITRWTSRVRDAEAIVAKEGSPRAPMILGSSWMACVPGALAWSAAREMTSVDSIDMSILYSLRDKSGGDSVEYMDRLHLPFPVVRDGKPAMARPYTEARRVTFPDGIRAAVYRFDSPDQHILPILTGAKSVAARMAFDSRSATVSLMFLVRSGLWGLLGGNRFRSLRRGLLHNPGPGAPHCVEVDIKGSGPGGRTNRVIRIVDPLGQTHMTAVGGVLQAEWALGLNGFATPGPGLHYGESIGPEGTLSKALAEELVKVSHDGWPSQ